MGRNKHPEETIKLIMDVAAKLFFEKGYDKTSLQDIINATNLSKGAIYHHFDSKEDIFEAIAERIGDENTRDYIKIRDDRALNGAQKLRRIFETALVHPNQQLLFNVAPNLLDNPRFLAMQIKEIYKIVVPDFIEPILREGLEDGSVKTDHPREAAEAMTVLSNLWLNPLAYPVTAGELVKRCLVFRDFVKSMIGVEIIDDEIAERYKINYCKKDKEE